MIQCIYLQLIQNSMSFVENLILTISYLVMSACITMLISVTFNIFFFILVQSQNYHAQILTSHYSKRKKFNVLRLCSNMATIFEITKFRYFFHLKNFQSSDGWQLSFRCN